MLVVISLQSWVLATLSSLAPTAAVVHAPAADSPRAAPRRARGDAGQTTAEYALVLIGAAALALLLITWATRTDQVGKLFDFVIQHVTGSVR